jgi:hypothetical protein
MRFLEAREWIRRAPAEVFDDLMDYQKLPSRTPLVTSVQLLTDPPVAVGSRFRVTYELAGKPTPVEREIVEYAPPHRCAIQNSDQRFAWVDVWELCAEGEGTRVTYTARFRPRDLWHVLVAPLIFVQTRRRMREGVARLKRRLEATREVEP